MTTRGPAAREPTRTDEEPARFAGFPKRGMAFFRELALEMNKTWFDANKARYQRDWVTPMSALFAEVAPRLGRAYGSLRLGPPKVMRIFRDVRFSKDKTPYKTHIAATIPLAGPSLAEGGCAALYLHIGLDEAMGGVGMYHFSSAQLAAWRRAVGGKEGAALTKIVSGLRARGYEVGGDDNDYKKVPRGFAEDHPHADLLKQRGLTAMFPAPSPKLLASPDLVDWLVTHGMAVAPLVRWLATHVAPA